MDLVLDQFCTVENVEIAPQKKNTIILATYIFRQRCEEDKCKLEHRIGEIMNERDAAHTELENLKVQLHLSEDKVDDLHNQLHETIRKLKESTFLRR